MNVPDETVRSGRNRRKPVGGKGVTLRDNFPIEWADLMARPDRSTKMAYALAGVIIGAILTRVFVLLRQQATLPKASK